MLKQSRPIFFDFHIGLNAQRGAVQIHIDQHHVDAMHGGQASQAAGNRGSTFRLTSTGDAQYVQAILTSTFKMRCDMCHAICRCCINLSTMLATADYRLPHRVEDLMRLTAQFLFGFVEFVSSIQAACSMTYLAVEASMAGVALAGCMSVFGIAGLATGIAALAEAATGAAATAAAPTAGACHRLLGQAWGQGLGWCAERRPARSDPCVAAKVLA